MIMKNIFVWTIFLSCSIWAAGKPTQSEAKKVLDFYNQGDEAILVDYKYCASIFSEGEFKNECEEEVSPSALKQGETVYLWMRYLVPQGLNLVLSANFMQGSSVLRSRDFNVAGSIRYRTWMTIPTHQSGAHTISIEQAKENASVSIHQFSYTIVE
jgi:hypothetical protein